MKKKLLFLVILFVGFIIFTLASVFLLKKEHDPEIKILSSPNATVTLDGKVIGKTPIDGFVVSAGEHMVILRVDKGAGGAASEVGGEPGAQTATWQGKISAFKNSKTYVDRELGSSDITSSGVVFWVRKAEKKFEKKDVGAIEITTDPIGTIIYLDNDEKGIAPLVMENVPVGEHEISAYSPGFIRRSQKIKVEAGYVVSGEIKLAIDKNYQKVEEPKVSTESATLSGTPGVSGSVTPTSSLSGTVTPSVSGKIVPTLKPGMKSVKIKDTPTGFLRVRASAGTGGAEVGQVNPGDTFVIIAEENGWIKIEYEKGAEGWVSGQYVERL